MKNILILISSVLFLTSCASKFVEVRLLKSDQDVLASEENYYEDQDSNSFDNILFNNIEVFDRRNNKESLGIKEYGDEAIEVINNQDLANLIKDKIIQNLQEDNQAIDKNKTLRITLKTLKYNSKRGFFLGKSKAKISIKASLVDNNTNRMEYGRTYNLENERPHFIISLEKTDQRTINTTLKNIVDQILEEEKSSRGIN